MNSDDLVLFLRVATIGNLSRTAIETGISQSALSRKMASLENELHTRLFHRSGRGVVLTESGQRLAKYANDVSSLLNTTMREMAESIHCGPSSIILAAQPTIARMIFGSITKALKAKYPGIHIRLREGLGGHIQEWLANGEIDAAIMYLSENVSSLDADVMLREKLRFIAPIGFEPLGKELNIKQLADVPLVIPSPPHGLRVLAESLAARYSKTLNISVECDASVSITKQLVSEGCGCTILPLASVQDEVERGMLQAVPLVNPDVSRKVAIITPRNRPPILSQWQVIQTVRRQIVNMVNNNLWPDATLTR